MAHALLVGVESKQVGTHALQVVDQATAHAREGPPAASSLAYLRDRVGVPRDLPLPAARQLRAHLNWVMDGIAAD